MKYALLLLLSAFCCQAADLQLFIPAQIATAADQALGSSYSFPDTPLGLSSSVVLRLKNTSTTQAYVIRKIFSNDTSVTITGQSPNQCLAPGAYQDTTFAFAPAALGAVSTPIEIGYASYATGCPSTPPLNVQVGTLATVSANDLPSTDLQVFVHTKGASVDGPAAGSTFTFPDTESGASSTVTLRLKNTSSTESYLINTVSSTDNSFTVDGHIINNCLAPNGFEDITLAFAPATLGLHATPVKMTYAGYSASAGCPAKPDLNYQAVTLVSLSGSAIGPTYSVSLSLDGNSAALTSGGPIGFGNVALGGTKTATLTVQNLTSATLATPAPSIVASVFSQPPYSLGLLTSFPSSLAAGASASFTLTFAPTQQALVTASLSLGSRSYPLTGTGIAGPGLESLLVAYTLPTGVHYTITTATPVDFGSTQTGSSEQFIFTISNPATNFAPETIPTVSLSGSSFSLASLPTLPVTLKPGDSTAFNVVFLPTQTGSQAATLSIGTLQFSLSGKSVAPTLNPTFQISPQILGSSEQAQLSIQLATAAQTSVTGILTMSFTSAVSGASDDPAIVLIASGSRTANLTFAPGASSATFAGNKNALTFQTGTTAGTIKFSLTTADGQTFTKSMDIAPALIQISSSTATRQSPYIVINLSAYDNTYSAGKMVFNFYDTKGALLTTGGLSVDETQDFHNYFFVNNQAGGAFSLQAKFPVTGDVTTIGAADVTIQNANGQSQTEHFNF